MIHLSIELLRELNRGFHICAELPGSEPNLRKWIKIAPFKEDDETSYRYVVRTFELKREWVEQQLDIAGYELNQVLHEASSLAEALRIAEEMLPGPVEWVPWRKSDCIV